MKVQSTRIKVLFEYVWCYYSGMSMSGEGNEKETDYTDAKGSLLII